MGSLELHRSSTSKGIDRPSANWLLDLSSRHYIPLLRHRSNSILYGPTVSRGCHDWLLKTAVEDENARIAIRSHELDSLVLIPTLMLVRKFLYCQHSYKKHSKHIDSDWLRLQYCPVRFVANNKSAGRRRTMSAAARKRISEMMLKRRAEPRRHKVKGTKTAPVVGGNVRTLLASGMSVWHFTVWRPAVQEYNAAYV